MSRLPLQIGPLHFIGIGGIGMSGVAEVMHNLGYKIQGSDAAENANVKRLRGLGITITIGHAREHLGDAAVVVYSSAVKADNPELAAARAKHIPAVKRAEMLAELMRLKSAVAIAGTHGKTTTTAMLAWVLHHAGRDPGFLIGGSPQNFETSYRIGTGPAFVIEGDEYDTAFFDKGPKFMHYRPDTALIGTVEFDHADIYRDEIEVKRVFRWLTNIVPRRGLIVRHEDCATTIEVTAGAQARVQGYGLLAGSWRAIAIAHGTSGVAFRATKDGETFTDVTLQVSGEYNVRNALAVMAAASEQGLTAAEIAAGLATFSGVRRRMEVKGEVGGIVVIDDFAHHPTAIAETLRAVRQRYPGRRVWCVLEPRSWSLRRNVFQDKLATAFDNADEIVLADVFGADQLEPGERLDPARLVADLARRGRPARFLPGVDAIVAKLQAETRREDVIAVLSNGGFGGIHGKLLEALKAKK